MRSPSSLLSPSVVRLHFRWSNYSLENLGLFNCSVTFNRLLNCQNLSNFTQNFVGVDVNEKKNTITIICSELGLLYDSTLPSNHFNLSTEGSDTAVYLHMYYFYIKLIKNIYISSYLLTSIFLHDIGQSGKQK